MNGDLENLEQKIRKARGKGEAESGPSSRGGREAGSKAGIQAGVEFVASIGICAVIGYWLDQRFGTMPLFSSIMFLAGAGAGFMSIYRASKNLGSAVGYSELHKRKKDANKAPEIKNDDRINDRE